MINRALVGLGLLGLVACGDGHNPGTPVETRVTLDDLCDTYCVALWQHCHDAWRPYPTPDACQKACSLLPQNGAMGDTAGDSLQCRLTYALYATSHNASAFCRQAGPDGGIQCRDPLP